MIDDWQFARQQWRDHGTKYLGYAAMACGAAVTMTLWFSPRLIQLFAATNMVLGGLTVRRGYTNSRNLDDDDAK